MKITILVLFLIVLATYEISFAEGIDPEPSVPQLAQAGQETGPGQPSQADAAQIDLEERLEKDRRIARSRFRYLMLGYGLIWIALGAYLVSLHRRVGRTRREIAALEARLGDLRVE